MSRPCTRSRAFRTLFVLALLALCNFGWSIPARAATLTVTNNGDSGAGSLRQAIADASAGDTITFDAGLSGQTITLAGELTLDKNLTIDGSSLATPITLNGNNAVRVMTINSGITATLTRLTITNGKVVGVEGGGIANNGTLTVNTSLFTGNSTTTSGGAIVNTGTLAVNNTTFSSNTATVGGAAIYSMTGAALVASGSTFVNNIANNYGGAIRSEGIETTFNNSTFTGNRADFGAAILSNVTTLNNSTFAGNIGARFGILYLNGAPIIRNTIVANNSPYNCDGTMAAGSGNNLFSPTGLVRYCGATNGVHGNKITSITLGALASNGGDTQTMALVNNSAALDAGNNATCLTTDQRGIARPQSTTCDIGAFEGVQYPLSVTTSGSGTVTSSPSGINCGSTCSKNYLADSVVNLSATPATDWIFAGWSGACTGTGSCAVTMSAARSVSATFVPADSTPPVITPSASGTLGSNGWYTSDVAVSWSVTDAESTVTSTSGCGATTINADTAGTTLTCQATSSGGTASQSVTIKRDATAPTIGGTAVPAANTHGWNNSTVTVSFTCADALAGVASCPADQTLSGEGVGQSAGGSATDQAGNSATTTVSGINIDKTAPATSGSFTIVTSSATVTLAGSDALSGVDSTSYSVNGGATQTYSGPFVISGAGDYTISYYSTDTAGNVETAKTLTFTLIVFPTAPLGDNFNRANGGIGANWGGATGTGFYRISGNRVDVVNDGPIYWNTSYGVNQEAYVTLTTVDPAGGEHDLLLKLQGGASGWGNGVIEVLYSPATNVVRVETFRPSGSWYSYPNIPVTYANGDQFGARVLATGEVQIVKNGVLVGKVTLTAADQAFFNTKGGYTGLWFTGSTNAFFDDFGAGTYTP